MVKTFLVPGSKLKLCQLGNGGEDVQGNPSVRPVILLDLPDIEVSRPLYQVKEAQP